MSHPRPIAQVSAAAPTYLVQSIGITSSLNANNAALPVPVCEDGGWLKGVCKEHGTIRMVKMTCKRRVCPVCGAERKRRIATRIASGVEALAGIDGAGWNTFTFDRDVTKKEAVKISNQMVQWLSRYMKRKFNLKPEWVKVWERHKSGRLHLNLVVAPWCFISKDYLAQKWQGFGGGLNNWIKRVGRGIGEEAAKSRWKCGYYFAKYDQMVLTGRGVAYSKGWPKLPWFPSVPRVGEISWRFVGNFSAEGVLFWYDVQMGFWNEPYLGEYALSDGEACHCFDFRENLVMKALARMAKYRTGKGVDK